jgi:hypothetical protein
MEPYTEEEKVKIEEKLKVSGERWYGVYFIFLVAITLIYRAIAGSFLAPNSPLIIPALIILFGLAIGTCCFFWLWIAHWEIWHSIIDWAKRVRVKNMDAARVKDATEQSQGKGDN